MSERIRMIGSWMGGDYAVSELAAEYGISRKTAYKWIQRFEAGGVSALEDRSRAPRHHPNAVAKEVEEALLQLKAQRPLWEHQSCDANWNWLSGQTIVRPRAR